MKRNIKYLLRSKYDIFVQENNTELCEKENELKLNKFRS